MPSEYKKNVCIETVGNSILCPRAQGATASTPVSERNPSNRKCVIGAVTCAVVVAMIVVLALVAIKLCTDADLERHRVSERDSTINSTLVVELLQLHSPHAAPLLNSVA